MRIMEQYGATPELAKEFEQKGKNMLARVTAVHKERYELVSEMGNGYGRLKPGNYYEGEEVFPTVGDFVEIEYNDCGDSRILRTLKRRSAFYRLDPSSSGHWEQAVAANFDYVFILQSLNANFNLRRLERYLTLAWQSGAIPVVVLTKADLKPDHSQELTAALRAAEGADVIAVSALTGQGLEKLEKYLQPSKTIVFLGSSGVGKSSLVNALAGRELMETGEIREDDARGRHTTTYRQLILNKPQRKEAEGEKRPCRGEGAVFIDTPGMRELGMWDVTEGLGQTFSDVEALARGCRFRDCKHQGEPGCAVRAAVEAGKLPKERLANYYKLKREARFSEAKESYRERKARRQMRNGQKRKRN